MIRRWKTVGLLERKLKLSLKGIQRRFQYAVVTKEKYAAVANGNMLVAKEKNQGNNMLVAKREEVVFKETEQGKDPYCILLMIPSNVCTMYFSFCIYSFHLSSCILFIVI